MNQYGMLVSDGDNTGRGAGAVSTPRRRHRRWSAVSPSWWDRPPGVGLVNVSVCWHCSRRTVGMLFDVISGGYRRWCAWCDVTWHDPQGQNIRRREL